MLTTAQLLTLGAILFCVSVAGIFLNRKNLLVMMMSIELLFLAVNMNFVAYSRQFADPTGQIMVFFILTVVAAETAVGLAIIVALFRARQTINVADIGMLKG